MISLRLTAVRSRRKKNGWSQVVLIKIMFIRNILSRWKRTMEGFLEYWDSEIGCFSHGIFCFAEV